MTESIFRHSINAKKLRALSAPLVNYQYLDVTPPNERTALLSGYMKVSELEPGMRLRLADIQDLFGLTSRAELPAGIKIALVIEGAAHVKYGQQETEVGPTGRSAGLVVVMPSSDTFVRHGRPGGREQTLILSLSPKWLARHGLGKILDGQDNKSPQLYHWTPSADLSTAARQLFMPPPTKTCAAIHQLQLSGFALSLAAEALSENNINVGLTHGPRKNIGTETPDRQLTRLMSLIDSGLARNSTQLDLAQHLGMSLSNLQRRFRAQYGEALGHYLRRYSLNIARKALIQSQVTVETAADLAGYTSAPNFSTAFRKEFGISPSVCRASARQTSSLHTINSELRS